MDTVLNFISKIKAERFFFFSGLFFGLYFIFTVPPFQVPDEPNHFYRAWHIADGHFSAEIKDQRIGGQLPLVLVDFVKTSSELKQFNQEKNSDAAQTVFVDFNNTALYMPWCYAPSVLAISICKLTGVSLLHTFYAARIFSLIFWLAIIYFSIWLIPNFKWTFCLLALLPMSIFINGSVSADVVTNAICFSFVALVIKLSYSHNYINGIKYILLAIATALVVSVKMVYAPLVLFLLFIPSGRFNKRSNYWLGLCGLFVVAGLMLLYQSGHTKKFYLSYAQYNTDYRDKAALVAGADMDQQTQAIISKPEEFAQVLSRSVVEVFDTYYCGFIGTFGWGNVFLPKWLILLMYLALLFTGLTEVVYLGIYRRLQAVVTFAIIFFLVFLSQHLIWNPVGGDRIMNIQGRYFIPAGPALLIAIGGLTRWKPALRSLFVITTALLGLIISAFILQQKYIS